MAKTYLYLVRHGKTMFNTLRRAQGWSDSPLTEVGKTGIRALGRGLKAQGVKFTAGYSSDSGRTIETFRTILSEQGQTDLSHQQDARIREWCFGSFEGHYDEELFMGILPRVFDLPADKGFADLTYPEIAQGLVEVDTANWAQPWSVLEKRLLEGFTAIAEEVAQSGGGNALVVSHGMAISTFLWILDRQQEKTPIKNGSVSLLAYEDGQFTIERVGDTSFIEQGMEELGHEA